MPINSQWDSFATIDLLPVNAHFDGSIYEFRRANLLELIRDKFEGNRSGFSRFVEKNVNMINLCLTANPELRRNIGERLARELEKKCNLPTGWLDEDKSPATMARSVTTIQRIGQKRAASDLIVENFVVYDEWLRRTHPGHDSYDGIKMHIIHDDAMEPTINRGDAVLVDTADDEGSGIFLLKTGQGLVVRRVGHPISGALTLSCDNSHYPSIEVEAHTLGAFSRVGRVIGVFRYVPM